MSKISLPKQMLPIREFPRIGIGKIDRKSLEDLYEHRLEASKIQLYHIRLPFRQPFATARSTLTHRDLMLVEVIDHAGRSGLGECTAFATDWYLPETLPDDARVLHEELAPSLLGEAFLHPREVSKVLQASPTGATHPMACSALEMAFWDLWGKIEGKPFWMQLNDEYEAMTGVRLSRGNGVDADIPTSIAVHAGAVVGMGSPRDTVQAVQACVDAGYKRVKLKISPGQGWVCAQAVRNRFPHLLVTLDANQSFSTSDFEELRAYDVLNIAWIEEPLNLRNLAVRDLDQAYRQISSLQRFVATPICIDESFTNYAEAMQALSYGDIHIVTMKIGKFGGIQNALRFFVEAQRRGRDVWMSGMYDTGISRRVHAAFQTLPGLVLPGDIGSVSRYFTVDVTEPPYHADQGMILLNDSEYECGIGCRLNRDAMAQVLVEQVVIE